jgi:hypothetical protein
VGAIQLSFALPFALLPELSLPPPPQAVKNAATNHKAARAESFGGDMAQFVV